MRLRSVAWPTEHGGWGILAEPALLGLLAAPSWPGSGIALAGVFVFLARHPLKLALTDRRRRRRVARTTAAECIAALYLALAAGGVALAATSAEPWWIPLAVAMPLALVQLRYDVRNEGRELIPEVVGGVALGALASAELLAGGRTVAVSLAAWALVASRAVAAVLYVRSRLRMDRGQAFSRTGALGAHVLGLLVAVGLAAVGLGPRLAVLAFALLLARAAHGLSPFHRPVRPQVVGLTEMAYGLAFVFALALGYHRSL